MQIAIDSKQLAGKIREKMEHYRTELLKSGMREPDKRKSSVWHWHFFKPMTELTAFVVNLKGEDQYIEITYGYVSTAFTRVAGCKNDLIELGVCDEDITIREKIIICDETDDTMIRTHITQMYEKYQQTTKDELLLEAKARRKAFIQQITAKLKSMGFRKKANNWTHILEGEYYLTFNAQKSSFSDKYYFNIYIGKNGINDYGDCYYNRVFPYDMCPVDWQILSQDEFVIFLNCTVIPVLEQIIHTPLRELGKLPSVWSCCSCGRKKCERCWVEKNLWEAKESI